MLTLTASMPRFFYAPEFLRVEAEWMRLAGRDDDARRLLLRAISTAPEHGSWALAVRSALAPARPSAAGRDADFRLLGNVCDRLPPENDTDYGREAKALLGTSRSVTT